MKSRACLRSGMCCNIAPCPYGSSISESNSKCSFLIEHNSTTTCSIYEDILKQPGADFSPAFGAGCCMPMFNVRRAFILARDFDGIEQIIEVKELDDSSLF